MGESVGQAAQFALAGRRRGGVHAVFDHASAGVRGEGRTVLIPESVHAPIVQRMVLVSGAGETARAFFAYLRSAEAGAILVRYGYALPAD